MDKLLKLIDFKPLSVSSVQLFNLIKTGKIEIVRVEIRESKYFAKLRSSCFRKTRLLILDKTDSNPVSVIILHLIKIYNNNNKKKGYAEKLSLRICRLERYWVIYSPMSWRLLSVICHVFSWSISFRDRKLVSFLLISGIKYAMLLSDIQAELNTLIQIK